MKFLLPIVFLFTLSSHLWSQPAAVTPKDFKKLAWLNGVWERTNVKPGKTAHERWEKSEKTKLTGYGVSMRGADTTFVEKLSIIIKDGAIFYVADVPENPVPVLFKFTSLTKKGFVCENPDHDFPKKISYQRNGDSLQVEVSGDGKKTDFEFVRKNKKRG